MPQGVCLEFVNLQSVAHVSLCAERLKVQVDQLSFHTKDIFGSALSPIVLQVGKA